LGDQQLKTLNALAFPRKLDLRDLADVQVSLVGEYS
jgi:hypothetical protein